MARSATYYRNRRAVLAESDVCAICGRPGADTADHIVPMALGGDDSLANLRPAHRVCNSRRGGRLATPRGRRTVAPGSSAVSLAPETLPDSAPRLETPYTAVGSYVDAVVAWARRRMKKDLLEWQVHYLRGVLAHDGAGKLVHRNALVSAARQNGKSLGAVALLGWYLEESRSVFGEDPLALIVSHDLRLTTRMFEMLVGILDGAGKVQRARYSFGRQDARLTNGAELVVQSDTPSAGHGFARVGLVYGDEVWHLSEEAWEQGLMPTTRTHPQPIILATSTAGDESSRLLRRWRERGLRLIDTGRPSSFYMAEWSPPPGVDVMEERWWQWANPALGHTLTVETLRAEADAPNRAAFLRASLNLWVASEAGWLAPGQWDALEVENLPAPAGGVLAVEVDLEGSRFVGTRAWLLGDGRAAVATSFVVERESELWTAVVAAMADPGLHLAATPSLEHHTPELYRRRMSVVGFAELARWTVPVRNAITTGRLVHGPDLLLGEHVERAVMTHGESGRALSSKRSPGPIELARCMVWATALVLRPHVVGAPAVGFVRR